MFWLSERKKSSQKTKVETFPLISPLLSFPLNSPHLLHVNVIILVRLGDIVAPRRPEEEEESSDEEEEVEDTGAAATEEEDDEEEEDSLAAFAAAAAASTMLLSTASSRGGCSGSDDARAKTGEGRLRGAAGGGGAIAKAMVGNFRQRCEEVVGIGIVSTTLAAAAGVCVARRCAPPTAAGLLVARRVLASIVVPEFGFITSRRCCLLFDVVAMFLYLSFFFLFLLSLSLSQKTPLSNHFV